MKIDESVHKYLNDRKILPDGNHMLYVGVKSGGCSGMRYEFQVVKFDPKKYFAYDVYVCSDSKSSLFLKNCTLKYEQSIGNSILVVENPAAVNKCGCGNSFNL